MKKKMGEIMKDFLQKVLDKCTFITSKFDGINELIFEKTGAKVNVGAIVLAIIFILMLILFIRLILGFVFNFLFYGDFGAN